MRCLALLLLCSFQTPALFAQLVQKVPPEHIYHRVYAVVPIIGTGKPGDPKRPMFVPSPAELAAVKPVAANGAVAGTGPASIPRPAILSYHMDLSDDGQFALVEFVGATPADLKFIAQSTAPGVIAFERGKTTKAQVQAEFQKYKKNFNADLFLGSVQ
jgi:hypothetical protein